MPLSQLTITLAPDGFLSVEALKETLKNALDMLESLEEDFVSSDTSVRWEVIKIRMSSPLRLTIAPRVDGAKKASIGKKIVKAAFQGVDGIEKGAAPRHFNEDALRAAKNLFTAAHKEGATMTISTNDKTKPAVTVTDRAVKNIDIFVSKARRYADVNTIEGRLEEISIHGKPHVRIWDDIPAEHAVRCEIVADLLPDVMRFLGRRVGVTGVVHYQNHKPQMIEVESIYALPLDGELPDMATMEPIDITGGMTSEDYIRRMRDDD